MNSERQNYLNYLIFIMFFDSFLVFINCFGRQLTSNFSLYNWSGPKPEGITVSNSVLLSLLYYVYIFWALYIIKLYNTQNVQYAIQKHF